MRWLPRFLRWLTEPRLGWLILVVLSLAIVPAIVLPFPPAEVRFRWGGLFLQLAGILTVAYGVKQTRLFFGQPRLREIIGDWFHGFPKFHQNATVTPDTLRAGAKFDDYAEALISTPDKPSAPIAERVDRLWREAENIWKHIADIEAEFDSRLSFVSSSLRQEATSQHVDHKRLEAKLEKSAMGGLYVSLTGALWLFIGVIMSTAAAEIACLIDR